MKKRYLLILLAFLNTNPTDAQQKTTYNPYELFSPMLNTTGVSNTRLADGSPSESYWQNKADYEIAVTLNENTNELKASETITYKNNSPTTLGFLWLQLDQNLFAKQSIGQARMPVGERSRYGSASSNFNGGYKIASVKVVGEAGNATYIIADTKMQIRLAKALKANGDMVKIKIEYSFTLPEEGADRCGILKTKNGNIFAVAQWYPRMCVYDDVEGWNALPYLGPGEFYCSYGDFDVSITAPASHIVAASGDLQNAAEVLTPAQLAKLAQAKLSDNTVMIKSEKDVLNPKARLKKDGTLTWKYKMINTRDFAWSSSAAFIWDAARINLPDGKKALAQSVYPVESMGYNNWSRSTEYTKASIENYSKRWYTYPYPNAINVATSISGMEYPGIVFCGSTANQADLFGVTDHEFGHTWFPMIVGSNERKFGWMDEGFNTFINTLAVQDFNNGEYKSSSPDFSLFSSIMFGANTEPIMTTPDAMKESNIGMMLYYKPAYGLTLLRNQILGADRFDFAFKEYIKRWAFKHPTPNDFFRTMNNVSGEDLSWFWTGWFVQNYNLDQSIKQVDTDDGTVVTLENKDKMAMPIILTYQTVSGKSGTINLPVQIWNNTNTFKVKIPEVDAIKTIVIDPSKVYPDLNYTNNSWAK